MHDSTPTHLLLSLHRRRAAGLAFAQSGAYPNRPVKIVVPFAAGGGPDILARKLGAKLAEVLGPGAAVVVENVVGAGGILAAQNVARMAPDGYNLLLGASSHVVQKAMQPSVLFDPLKDFTHIARVGDQPVGAGGGRRLALQDGGRPGRRGARQRRASSTTPPAASAARPTCARRRWSLQAEHRRACTCRTRARSRSCRRSSRAPRSSRSRSRRPRSRRSRAARCARWP